MDSRCFSSYKNRFFLIPQFHAKIRQLIQILCIDFPIHNIIYRLKFSCIITNNFYLLNGFFPRLMSENICIPNPLYSGLPIPKICLMLRGAAPLRSRLCFSVPPEAGKLLPSVFCPLSPVFRLLSPVFCLLTVLTDIFPACGQS